MKLEWQQNPPEKPMSWYEAIEYTKSLGEGWRLPTVEELKEAYDNNVEGFQSFVYWSSSTYAQPTIGAWGVSFSDGDVDYYYKTGNFYVRCVRDVK
jgi:hypothetical protein